MPEPMPVQTPSPQPAKKRHFVRRHPALAAFAVFALLLAIFIGQNLEPTSVDFLFWSLWDVPKIVLLIIGVPVGALGWELVRRAFR